MDGYSSLPPNPPPVSAWTTRACPVVEAEAALERRVDVVRALERAGDGHPAVVAAAPRSSRCSRCRAAPGGRPGTRPRGRGRRPRRPRRGRRSRSRRPRTRGPRLERVEHRRQRLGPDPDGPPSRPERRPVRRGEEGQRLGVMLDLATDRHEDRLVVLDRADDVLAGDVGGGRRRRRSTSRSRGSRSSARNRACASVERIVAPYQAPGKTRSSAYLAAPVSLAGPSRRSGAAPRARPGTIVPGSTRTGAGGAVRVVSSGTDHPPWPLTLSPGRLRARPRVLAWKIDNGRRTASSTRFEENDVEDLTGTVAVVTGASSGIGRATARELLGAGARVVIGARRRDRLEAIEADFPDRAVAVAMDVRSPDDCRRLVATADDPLRPDRQPDRQRRDRHVRRDPRPDRRGARDDARDQRRRHRLADPCGGPGT